MASILSRVIRAIRECETLADLWELLCEAVEILDGEEPDPFVGPDPWSWVDAAAHHETMRGDANHRYAIALRLMAARAYTIDRELGSVSVRFGAVSCRV